uniref:Uncharacterized protein n=1 Tax=Romanomermis culicivorax TaxID=13658 RepID=A0A915KK87_ROMCU
MCTLALKFQELLVNDSRFELTIPATLGLVCFRLKADNDSNKKLVNFINDSHRIHLVGANLKGQFVLRFSISSQLTTDDDVKFAWSVICDMADKVMTSHIIQRFAHITTTEARRAANPKKEINFVDATAPFVTTKVLNGPQYTAKIVVQLGQTFRIQVMKGSLGHAGAIPTLISIKMTTKELTFPAVTFCSTNPYMASKIFKSERVKQLMHIIEKNAESIKEDMPIDSTNVANRLKRQVEQATTQSSGIVDAYMDENCYDVSDLDMWTSNSSPTTTASTHLPNESSKTTRPSPLAETNSLTSGQSVSPFFVSSSKFNSVRPLVSDIDPSTAKNNEAGGQEYDYDDGGNCTADSLDTTSDRITKNARRSESQKNWSNLIHNIYLVENFIL